MNNADSWSRPSSGLKHRIDWHDKRARIFLEGEVDMRVAPSLRNVLHGVIEKEPEDLAVDLSKVPFIDSSGVATFVEALRIRMRSQKTLRLENPSDAVRYTLKITQLLKVFGIEENGG
jgi:anti-sigma B factor antagonist